MKLLLLISAMLITQYAFSQEKDELKTDSRLEKVLDREKLEFTINSNKDFSLNFELEQNRTQVVIANSNTNIVGELEIREFHSVAWKGTSLFDSKIAFDLLQKNDQYKIGGWCVHKDPDGVYYLMFIVKTSAELNGDSTRSMLELCAAMADEMENQLTPGSDEF